MAKLPLFSGEAEQVVGFITTCKLYIRMRLREESVEEQVQWILRYMQRGSADIYRRKIFWRIWKQGKSNLNQQGTFWWNLRRSLGEEIMSWQRWQS